MKIFTTILFCSFIFLSGCSTTKLASYKSESSAEKYQKFAIFFLESEFSKRKILEDSVASDFKSSNTAAIQSYKLFPPTTEYSKAALKQQVSDLLNTGADAILIIRKAGEKQDKLTVSGGKTQVILDNEGRTYRGATPTEESYVSHNRSFRAEILDVKSQKIVWYAELEGKTFAPAELSFLSDFYESAAKNISREIVFHIKKDGLVNDR